jgi:hypothetical protein
MEQQPSIEFHFLYTPKKFVNGELVEARAIQGDSVLLADGRVNCEQ